MMKKKKIILIIIISALSLAGLVSIQLNWMQKASQFNEEQYHHRVSLALWWVKDRLEDQRMLRCSSSYGSYMVDSEYEQRLMKKVDSLLKLSMVYYSVDLNYRFVKTQNEAGMGTGFRCHLSDMLIQEGLVLVLDEPQKPLLAGMDYMHYSSVIMIIAISGCFLVTILTILRQKKLAEMTADFINNMTHELKTPIATIALASNMLKKERVLDDMDKAKSYASIIHEENGKLQEQVEQVLQIARFEKGEFKVQKVETDIHELINNAIHAVDLQILHKNGKIDCNLSAKQVKALADELHITNTIANLLDNANKYSPDSPQITVTTRNEKDGIVISVTDKGIGINKENQKRIFERFYRVQKGNIHDVKGFGLGLAYVKMVVDAHHGEIYLKSEPGKGSTFEVYIPYQ
jgi:two-component system, OmpR family, phosphate regulon sensor histidine kinase PhoR